LSYFPPIPARFYCSGNRDEAVKLIPEARKILGDVHRDMVFSKFPVGRKVRQHNNGAKIQVDIKYGLSTALIYVPGEGKQKTKEEIEHCWCFPCLSFCVIRKVYLNGIVQDDTAIESETKSALESGYRYYYNVSVCNAGTLILLEGFNVKSAGFGMHPVGQYCLLTIDVGFVPPHTIQPLPNCCINSACLVSDIDNTDKLLKMFLSVVPIHINEGMTE